MTSNVDGWTLPLVHGWQLAVRSHARHPELFANVKCMCSPLVPSMSAIFQAFSELQGVARTRKKLFDMLAAKEKEMIWVQNTTRRFKDGYNYFGRYPEKVLSFFPAHEDRRERELQAEDAGRK